MKVILLFDFLMVFFLDFFFFDLGFCPNSVFSNRLPCKLVSSRFISSAPHSLYQLANKKEKHSELCIKYTPHHPMILNCVFIVLYLIYFIPLVLLWGANLSSDIFARFCSPSRSVTFLFCPHPKSRSPSICRCHIPSRPHSVFHRAT